MKRLLLAVFVLVGTLLAQAVLPDLTVRHVTLTTTTPVDLALLQQILRSLKTSTQESAPADQLKVVFGEITRDVLQQHGYFKAQVTRTEVHVLKIDAAREMIDLVLEVAPGDRYRLQNIAFNDQTVFTSDRLRHEFNISDGDVFNIARMRAGLENLRKLYVAHGHIDFTVVPDTQIDESKRTIALSLDLDEGPIFHLGRLKIDGDEWRPGTTAKLLSDWKKYQGMPYSPAVLRNFLREEHASAQVDPDSVFRLEVVNATPTWPNLDVPPYTINVRMTLANPIGCRPAPGKKLVQLCWLSHPDKMVPPR